MGKLAERLSDARRSGVYRVETTEAVEEAAALNGFALERFALDGGLPEIPESRNGRVLLFSGFEDLLRRAPEGLDPLLRDLDAAADRRRQAGQRFFAAFLDPQRTLCLPPLYNWDRSRQTRRTDVEKTRTEPNALRRRILAAGATGAAAGLGGWSSESLAQAADAKPLPPLASFKDASRVIVHSASGIETRREAFGTSGVTDSDILFLRNNIAAPNASIAASPDAWEIEIDGVTHPRKLALAELKRLGVASVSMVLQCSGNGRGFFGHKASGSQWKVGAAGNTLWGGVPVKAVVAELGGVRAGMRYMTSTGGEVIPAGIDAKKAIVERSVPWTAMEEAILAWELNGEPTPLAHGGPLRLIVPGYYGVNNIKYVKRLAFTVDQTDAAIQSSGYRVRPIGEKGAPAQPSMWQMNLKSFVTSPAGGPLRPGPVQVHGVAFSGASPVSAVEVSLDGGKTWRAARFFGPDLGRYAWRQFVLPVSLAAGSYEIASRAIADDGETQPELRVENERGYAHNGWRDHAVKVTVT